MEIKLEGEIGVTEVGLGVVAGLGTGIETKGVGLMGGNEGMCKARKVRLENLRARN